MTETPTPTPPGNKTPSFWVKLRVFITNFLVWWKAALAKIRTRLPESVNRKLPDDNILSGAIAALFIFLFWAIAIASPAKPPKVATVPPISTTVPAPEVIAPPIATAPPEVTTPEEVTLPPSIEAPVELAAPSTPEPVEVIPPPPPPVPTPEQTLIAAIQKQVSELTNSYANGLIRSIQANFQAGVLTLKISDDWYNFDAAKQDNLAADMWDRAQQLNFGKLEISDSQDRLLARSAVIGSNMVILQRSAVSSEPNLVSYSLLQ